MKLLLVLQNQEKGVEGEIAKLKNKIYEKMKEEGIQLNPEDKTAHILSQDNVHLSPFGNLKDSHKPNSLAEDTKTSLSNDDEDQPKINEEKVLNAVNLKPNMVEKLRSLSKRTQELNETKFINWKIENRGKQTIILL